jgi:NDP-sugar pyrophosphorylase family protein
MLVAAGFGTRLGALARELPKPALPVANRPVAWFACDHLARSGITEVVVNTHHLADRLQAALERWRPPELALRFVHEPQILGTGGGVRNAWQPLPGEDFLVVNAKLLFAPNLALALRAHREQNAIATLVLRRLPAGSSFAKVVIDHGGRVHRIRDAGRDPGGDSESRMYTGVQILSARAWHDLPQNGDIVEHAYRHWLERGEIVASVTDDGPWMDVGVSPRHYLDANLAVASGQVPWPGIATTNDATILAAGVKLGHGCSLDHVVLGEGVHIAEGVTLERVVAWPDAHIDEDLRDAIVTTSGVVVPV